MLDAISKEAAQALAKAFVDELVVKYPPNTLRDALVGRTITFTIENDAVKVTVG